MLEDRDYMRAESGGGGPLFGRLPAAMWLVIVNVLFFVLQLVVPLVTGTGNSRPITLEHHLALRPMDLIHGHVWQLLTFQLLHAGPFHLLINCFMLYIFGRPVEAALGRANFLKLYFSSGAVGGLLQVLFSFAFREHFGFREGLGFPPVVGASAGVFGLVAAFATLFREQSITMLLAFIIPVTMRAKYLLYIEAGIAVLGMLDARSHVAHAAHLGGMLMGVFYVKQIIHWNWRWPRLSGPTRRAPSRELVNVGASKFKAWPRERSPDDEPLSTDEFLSKEVDPILEKISQHGIHSLTERERKILEAARRKMGKQ